MKHIFDILTYARAEEKNMTKQNSTWNFFDSFVDAFRGSTRNASIHTSVYTFAASLGVALLLPSCSKSVIESQMPPGNANGNSNPKIEQTIEAPATDVTVMSDSTARLFNNGTANAFSMVIDLKKDAVGIPIILSYTGKDRSASLKDFTPRTVGYDAILNSANVVSFDVTRKDGTPILQDNTGAVPIGYNSFAINQIQREKIVMTDAGSMALASSQYDLWTTKAKKIACKIVSITGYAGVANTVKVNNTVYNVK